ncbi:MAG: Iron-binding zinc finger CDGSH type [Pelotomaculum sp. PtaB.Bin104]|nr:MAG: Iron-binding zinc finger CDGSH type [Pelotomaculum sp. PtaB.Bin104]
MNLKLDVSCRSQYAICRCGKSKNAPFCDGSHEKAGFIGAETASRAKYEDRAELMEGSAIDLLDDRRCAFARFCHREKGNVWKLTEDRIARKTEEKRSRLPVIARRGSHPVPLRQIKQQAFLRRNACFYKFFR